MSTDVANIKSGIITRISTVLGSGYSVLGYATDINKNSFKASNNRYAVLANGISQTEDKGLLGSFTVEQNFEVILTNSYAQDRAGDSSKVESGVTLMDQSLLLYKDIVEAKAGTPSIVLLVNNMSMDQAEYLEEDNVVIIRMTFGVTYRKSLT